MGKLGSLKIIAAAVIFLIFSDVGFPAVQPQQFMPRPAGSKNPRYQTRGEKLQQLQQESTTAVTDIDADYTKIIGYVNTGQTPTEDELDGWQKTVLKNRKYLMVLDDSQRSVYHTLSAWVYYFDQKNDKALKQAETSQKLSPQNLNTVKTRLALSLLYKDYSAMMAALTETAAPKQARRIPQTTQNGMPGMPGAPSFTSAASTAAGELVLDINAVRIELINKTFDSNLSPLDSTLPSWQSSGRLLCAILWKIDSDELDNFAPVEPNKTEPNEPNAPTPTPTPTPSPMPGQEQNIPVQPPQEQAQSKPSSGGSSPVIAPGAGGISPVNPNFMEDMAHPDSSPPVQQPQPMPAVAEQSSPPQPMPMYEPRQSEQMQMPPGMMMPPGQQPYTDGQTKETTVFDDFAKLQSVFAKDKRTAFVAINFNDQTKKENILNWLKKNPQKWQTVFPASEQSVLSSVSENIEEPILLIVAPDSTIRYAGRADGFLPQMIIDSILNNPEDANKVDVNLPAIEYQQPIVEHKPDQQTAEQAVLPPVSQDSSSSQQGEQKIVPAPATAEQDDDFFDPRAETLIENAKAFFKIGNRLQFHTYAKPIEMCRTVMKDYPNTKYATQAQALLRQAPERFRARFNLTDEELGL